MLNDKQKEKERLKKDRLKLRAMTVKKKKQFSRSKLVAEADRVFSLYIRGRDAWKPCCTCGTAWQENFQCGHFMSRRHYLTRWLHKNAHGQCPKCNLYWSWEQYKHSVYINHNYFPTTADFITELSTKTDKTTDSELLSTIQHYYRKCFELGIEYKPKKQFLTQI